MGLYPASGQGRARRPQGRGHGPARVQGRQDGAAAADREHLPGLQGRLALARSPRRRTPSLERTWTKKDALVAFKNPKKDILVYLEADTNAKAFDAPPVLTLAVAGKTGVVVPIADSEIFMKKVRVKAADLGTEEWVDLRLSMNQSFVPKVKNLNAMDDRELGLMVYHLYVGEADALGKVDGVVDAGPVTLPSAPATAASPAKPAPAPAKPPVKSS